MAHVTTGIRRILEFGFFYDLLMDILGRKKGQTKYVNEYVKPVANEKILDIGCGTANILTSLPKDIDYTGLDLNEKYIKENKKKFPGARFFVSKADDVKLDDQFDIILCNALMHHLEDGEIRALLKNIKAMLKPTGRVIIFDAIRVPHQHFLAKIMMDMDRGQNIKFDHEFKKIVDEQFSKVKMIHTNLSWFPYNHLITEAKIN